MEIGRQYFTDYYDILSILGIGAFGVVISAVDKEDGQTYAIKIIKKGKISPNRYSSLRKEAEIMSILDHPNIVQFHKVLESPEYFLIVMELVRGSSLKKLLIKRLKHHKPFSEAEA